MPLVSFNTKADFDRHYRIRVEIDGVTGGRLPVALNYHRAAMMPFAERHADKLVELFAWPLSTRIAIVGAGFGWVAEVLETKHGYTNIIGIDTSPWIQNNQDTSEEPEIDAAMNAVGLDPTSAEGIAKKANWHTPGNRRRHSRTIRDESLANNGSRSRIRSALGGGVDVGITEEVITTLSDAEAIELSNRVHLLDGSIDLIHVTTELYPDAAQDPAFNWKTLEEWKLLIPADTFVSVHDWQVL